MKTLGIITINHNRPQVLSLWCAQIRRLRQELNAYVPAVVVSEASDNDICLKYAVWHIASENRPVTSKFNRAFAYMKSLDVDYVLITGSDDIVSTEFVQNTVAQMELGIDLIGTNTIYFYCGQGIDRGTLTRLDSPILKGIGKTVSKKVLDQCDWVLWNEDKNWGMDSIASKTIAKYAKTKAVIGGMVVDIKTKQNLNSFNVFKKYPKVAPQEFYNILSGEEITILNSL